MTTNTAHQFGGQYFIRYLTNYLAKETESKASQITGNQWDRIEECVSRGALRWLSRKYCIQQFIRAWKIYIVNIIRRINWSNGYFTRIHTTKNDVLNRYLRAIIATTKPMSEQFFKVTWNATGEIIFGSQCVSSVLPVVFQWLLSDLSLCSNYAN